MSVRIPLFFCSGRIHKVMEVLKVAVEFFFIGWFLGYYWFFYDKPSPDNGSLLYWVLAATFVCIFVAFAWEIAEMKKWGNYHARTCFNLSE
ncbi:hypothetical protein YC2023_057761 [Brassica napus]